MKSPRRLWIMSTLLLGACGDSTPVGTSTFWVESLQLCAETVDRVGLSYEAESDKPLLTVELNDEAGRHFSRMTARLIGEPMRFRLDDKMVAEPIVAERITVGSFQLTNLSPEELERARQEMEQSCGPSRAAGS